MNSKGQPTGDSNVRSVFIQTGMSFFWKLVIVMAGVVAYYGLNSMESSKGRYDKARNAPIVIVDELAPNPTETGQERNSVELKAASVKAFFKDNKVGTVSPSAEERKFIADMEGYVDRAKYQPFKNGDELLDRLNQEILKDEAADEGVRQAQMDIIHKQYVAKQTALLTQINEKCQPEIQAQEPVKANHARPRQKAPPRTEDLNCKQLAQQIANSETDHTRQSEAVKNKFAQINRVREARVRRVYDYMRPQLLAQIEEQKGKQPIRSFAYFFPSNVLDEKNGIHVIYSIFWLTCMVMLIFGVLFLILLVLRPLPPFAGGAEALSDQARSFLTKRSATPELAKTLIVTTAAIGIGTVVAVAGGMNMPTAGRITAFDPQAQYQINLTREGVKPGEPPKPAPQGSPVINVTAYAPITYPTPMTISIPSSEGPRIDALAREFGTLGGQLHALKTDYDGINAQFTLVDDAVKKTVPLVDQLGKTAKEIKNEQVISGINLSIAQADLDNLQQRANSIEVDFFKRAEVFNATLQDLRNDQLRQSSPLRTQNIFTRTKQLFTVGPERYLVTGQSYLLLRSMMCTVQSNPATNTTSSSTTTAAAPCTLDTRCNCTSDMATILNKLKNLIGGEPMTEDAFMSNFDANERTKLKLWKPVILKYTRAV
jgi:hypothetical protein